RDARGGRPSTIDPRIGTTTNSGAEAGDSEWRQGLECRPPLRRRIPCHCRGSLASLPALSVPTGWLQSSPLRQILFLMSSCLPLLYAPTKLDAWTPICGSRHDSRRAATVCGHTPLRRRLAQASKHGSYCGLCWQLKCVSKVRSSQEKYL